jgi:hypothetical protein
MLGIDPHRRVLLLVAILLAVTTTGAAAKSKTIARVVGDSKREVLTTARHKLKNIEPVGGCPECLKIHVTKRPDKKWLARIIRHSK